MKVLIVSGSPHRDGLCMKLAREVAEGVKEVDSEVELITLAEKRIGPCLACEQPPCWQKMACRVRDDALEVRRKLNSSDALAFIAPVYFLSVNGLAKDFMDRMRYYGETGKPALAVAVAGGTGKGCISALQDICRWLIILGFRPINPLPVTRYNLDVALVEARVRGRWLAKLKPQYFSDLAERIAYYESLPYMKYGMADEIIYLTREAIEGVVRRGRSELAAESRRKLETGEALLKVGKFNDGLKLITEAQEESMQIFNSITR
ncbi:MAG: flavodoxin family protein [Candidatus Bathyarchaeia archaeon]